jgi:hypothetical protein
MTRAGSSWPGGGSVKRWASVLAVASLCVGCGGGSDTAAPEPTATAEAPEGAAAPGVAAGGGAGAPASASRPASGGAASSGAARPASSAAAPAGPAAPAAPAAPAFREVTLPEGTRLSLRLQSSVASDTSKVEDAVRAELREAVTAGGATALPAGTEFSGTVTAADRSGRVKGVARVAYRFDSLTLAGERHEIVTAPLVHEAEATKSEDATKVAVGAAAGAAVGALLGGGSGAAKGAAIGAAGGTGVVLATRGEEVRLGPGASVTSTLSKPLTIRIPAR